MRRVIENFLTSGIEDSQDVEFMRRIRLLNLTGLMLVALGLIWSITYLSHRVWLLGAALLFLMGMGVGVLVLLRRYRRPALFSNCSIGILLVGISVANWYTGGLGGANVAPYFIVPVVSIALLGRWGLLWVLATVVVVGGFVVLTFGGYHFPHVMPDDARKLDTVFTWSITFFFLVALAYHYESYRSKAERRIFEEKERAEEAARTKSQFLANMSHELRTPLNAIIGLTDLTLRMDLGDEQLKNLQRVKKKAYSLLDVVEDVLDVSRLEAARLEIHVAPFDLRAQATEAVENLRVRADSKRLQLRLELSDGLPVRVRGDAVLVRKILDNLLDNAVKFTDDGSVTVRIVPGPQTGITFLVEDTGIGIPPDRIENIFDSFTQVDASTTRRHVGTGLGLAICREITKALGGEIGVESRPGRGSRFRVWLPFVGAEPSREDADGRRILAVEDDAVSRELVETILRGAGFLVDTAADGRSAVEAVRSGKYHLVLMDVQMPGMDGLVATRQIRSNEPEGRRVPIVAITAYALEDERQRCLQAGMDDFVTKPIESESLVNTVLRWVGSGTGS